MKKKILTTLSVVLILGLAALGILAYLQSEDSDVNVMTLGNVEIAQHEYQRVQNDDGTYEIDSTGYKLEPFKQDKPLYPAVIPTNGNGWDWQDTNVMFEQVGANGGGMQVFTEPNAVDKFVFVENTGKSDAYVRTLIAYECGSETLEGWDKLISTSNHFSWDDPMEVGLISINDNNYVVLEYVYKGRADKGFHENGVLPAGEVTQCSLGQVYMKSVATNENCEALDGNKNGKYDILVLSQAVQVEGFDNAATALETAFPKGDNNANVAGWFEGVLTDGAADTWDGTADTTWYDPENPKTEYLITTAEQMAGLAELVSGDTTFKGVTLKLGKDIDLYCEDTTPSADGDPLTFRPIGDHSKNGTFEGKFDGNGKTISNLYQNGWDLGYQWGAYGSYGLFGNVNDATIKNLTISGSESYIEGGDTSFIAGSATGKCIFENITIKDSVSATYNNGNGGIIGWSGAGNYTFKDITIAEDCVLAGLWGSFDSSIGGIVGQGEPGATYNFENVDIACRIDAYNDCTASYDYYNYRMCGMIIGRLEETTTIDGSNYPDTSKYNITCNNVTVTYGDWYNYHYCDPTPGYNNGRGMRVEPGYSYDGLPSNYDHSQCTTHHNELIPFDQIFGGDQYGVKGLKTYTGVTVNYPN